MPQFPGTATGSAMPRPARHALRGQLIVTTHPDRAERHGLAALEETAAALGGSVASLFGPSYGHVRDQCLALRGRGVRVPDLSVFHSVTAPEAHYAEIARRLRRL